MAKALRRGSELEARLWEQIAIMVRAEGWPEPVTEYRFGQRCCEHAKRQHFVSPTGKLRMCLYCPAPVNYFGQPHDYAPARRWRFDFAWVDRKLAVEVEGGAWVGGRHGRGKGFTADLEKYVAAQLDGWAVIRIGPQQIEDGTALALIERALRGGLTSNP